MTIKGKDLIEQIKDKEYSEDLIKELEKYEIKKPKTVYDLTLNDGFHFLVFRDGEWKHFGSKWWDVSEERGRRELGLVHLTKERAEHHARVLNTEMAIKKWKRENDNVELDWGNAGQFKFSLLYDVKDEKILIYEWRSLKIANTIYFSSRDKAKQCIYDIGKERIIEWTKWEDNDE